MTIFKKIIIVLGLVALISLTGYAVADDMTSNMAMKSLALAK